MNIDIAKCYKLVYNCSNLEGISNLEIWGGIMACNYREDIVSILERGPKFMSKEETGVFLDAVDKASSNKEVQEDLRLEKTWEERWQWIEAIARDDMKEKAKKELRGEVTKQVTEELTEQITADLTKQVTADVTKQVTADVIDNIIKSMLQKDISYLDISDITGKSINYIKDIERSLH